MQDDNTSQSHTVIVLSNSEDDFDSSWPSAAHPTVPHSLETSVVKIEEEQEVKVRTCII